MKIQERPIDVDAIARRAVALESGRELLGRAALDPTYFASTIDSEPASAACQIEMA